jgi:hypothetical protein
MTHSHTHSSKNSTEPSFLKKGIQKFIELVESHKILERINLPKDLFIIIVVIFILCIDGGLPHLFFHGIMNEHTHEH